jgi:hypothetical protein
LSCCAVCKQLSVTQPLLNASPVITAAGGGHDLQLRNLTLSIHYLLYVPLTALFDFFKQISSLGLLLSVTTQIDPEVEVMSDELAAIIAASTKSEMP